MGNLLAHINMPSFRQICQTLVLAPGAHVVERPLLEGGLQFQCQANTGKRIRSPPGLMAADDELEGIVLTERILDAVDFVPTVDNR